MYSKKSLPSVNLVRRQENSFFDNLLNWILTFGRFLIIATELIALGAFLYRFSLDRKLVNLNDQIKQKEAVVNLLRGSELTYRNLQDRLSLASRLNESAAAKKKILTDVIAFAPSGFSFDTIIESGDSIMITAQVTSSSSLADFIDKLKNYQYIDSVSLNSIANKTSQSSIAVGISAVLKKGSTSGL
ncbi:hypothetical protein M1615_05110 [Patescibacteria group bacterium]|nr:hypothetical protein [Patescibacteria group bacterium]MCL5010047.1 hypothetical protein [Patescibacteria group bacterium]